MRSITVAALACALLFTAVPSFAGGSGCSYSKDTKMVASKKSCAAYAGNQHIVHLDTKNWKKAKSSVEKVLASHSEIKNFEMNETNHILRVAFDSKEQMKTFMTDMKAAGEGLYTAHEPKLTKTSISVKGMTCGGCVKSVKKALQDVKGVAIADVDLESGTAEVMTLTDVDAKKLEKAIKKAGFKTA